MVMRSFWTRFVKETEGQDLIEYALLAAAIALGSATIIGTLGTTISGKFTNINTALTGGS
jgi:pilus assembly protein Flp/PilA